METTMNSNTPFVYIDKNPKMELIGYMDLQKDNSSKEYFSEDMAEWELVA